MTLAPLSTKQLQVLRAVVERGIAGLPMRELPSNERPTAWSLERRHMIEPSHKHGEAPATWHVTELGLQYLRGLPVASERELEVGNGKTCSEHDWLDEAFPARCRRCGVEETP